MTTTADIERLKALVDRLLPLSTRARGELIAADDWNTVVGALLEVARALVTDGPDTAVPPHQHQDQVTSAWLDPRLRAQVERGPLADPAASSRLTALERGTTLGTQQLDQLSAQVRDLRAVSSRQETNDLDRASALTALSRTVDGLSDPRDDVGALRNSLDALGTNVAAVSAFAAGLGDVTPAALRDGLAQVNQLRQQLTTPTGALLDAAEFERRMTELRTTLVTEDELTTAIGNVRPRLPNNVRTDLLNEATAAAQRQAETSAGTLVEQLRGQLAGQIDDVRQSVQQAARDATGQFRDELQAAITAQLRPLIDQGDASVRDGIGQAVSDARAALQAAVDQRVGGLEASLDDRVSAAVAQARPDLLNAVNTTVNARLADLTNQIGALQNGVRDVRAAVTSTATDVAALRQSSAAALDQQITGLRAETAANLGAAIRGVRAEQSSGLDTVRAELAADRGQVSRQFEDLQQRIPGRVVRPINPLIVERLDPNQPPG